MHPEVQKYIEQFENEAEQKGLYRKTLGKSERSFLENVWGPLFHFRFSGLKAEYPFKDFKGGDRFIDFVYVSKGIRLVIEIDGFTTHARDISPREFEDHLMRQNDLILSGWMILRFSVRQVDKNSRLCQRVISQAIGHWWTMIHGQQPDKEPDIWSSRTETITQLALQRDGQLRVKDVTDYFHISRRTALNWINKLVSNEILIPVCPNQRITGYSLKGH